MACCMLYHGDMVTKDVTDMNVVIAIIKTSAASSSLTGGPLDARFVIFPNFFKYVASLGPWCISGGYLAVIHRMSEW